MEGFNGGRPDPLMRTAVDYNAIPWQHRGSYSGLCFLDRRSYAEGDSREYCTIIECSREGPFKEVFKNGTIEEGNYKNNHRVGTARRIYPDGRIETLNYDNGEMDGPIAKWWGEIQDKPKWHEVLREEVSSAVKSILPGIFSGKRKTAF